MKARSDSVTGVKYLSFHKASGLWRVRLRRRSVEIVCKYFRDKDDAIDYCYELEEEYCGEDRQEDKATGLGTCNSEGSGFEK